MFLFDKFKTDLMQKYEAKKRIYLLLDKHLMHRSENVKEYVEDYRGKLKIFYLPLRGAELNSDERV